MEQTILKPYFKRETCRLCGKNNLERVLELSPTPLCDAYVPLSRVNAAQDSYPLELFLCKDCGYVHLPYVVNPELIYLDYIYVTTSSLGLKEHFGEYAKQVLGRLRPAKGSLVIDIGSNDGTLLKFFKEQGMRVLGIEPAKEIAEEASGNGIETLPKFFSSKFADEIKERFGQADIITINNLLANIDDLEDIAEGVKKLLAPGGVFIIESSYLGDLIRNMVFDFIYHEHLSYFHVKPLISFFKRFGMELIEVERVATKGGSLRYYFSNTEALSDIPASVKEVLEMEDGLGLDDISTYRRFSEKITQTKRQLLTQLNALKAKGKAIAGFGGSATTTTLLYHFDLTGIIEYIVDDNPAKQNTFSPGYHIPVLPPEVLYARKPDYVMLLAWRYTEPIMKKHKKFLEQGGHFIVPLPEIKVV